MKIIFRLLIMEIKTRKYFTLKIIAKTTKYVVSRFSRIVDHPSSKVGSWASISLNFLGLTQMDPRVSLQMLFSWPHSGFERNNSIHTATLKCCLMRNLFILNYVIYIYIYILKKGGHLRKHQAFATDDVHLM